MGKKRTGHPDHYQTRPPPPEDEMLYAERVRKVKDAKAPPLRTAHTRASHAAKAGDVTDRAAVAKCVACGIEIAVRAEAVLPSCPACGGKEFRILGGSPPHPRERS